jgi:pilus assembly protein Flp/PilA
MNEMIEQVKQYLQVRNNEKGATMVEYALMLALIAIVCILAVTHIGSGANTMFTNIATHLGQ